MSTETAPRILISRMSAIGDTILTMPVACALRQHFPDAYIAWVVEKKAAPMIRKHSTLDQVIELERGLVHLAARHSPGTQPASAAPL